MAESPAPTCAQPAFAPHYAPHYAPQAIEANAGAAYLEPAVAEHTRTAGSLEARLPQAIHIREQLDRVRSWQERLSPGFQRAFSSGKLLFQVVGAAGYAGYFVSMHALMRIVSGALMAGTWYAIYRIKGLTRP
jgi:hypothetical protein